MQNLFTLSFITIISFFFSCSVTNTNSPAHNIKSLDTMLLPSSYMAEMLHTSENVDSPQIPFNFTQTNLPDYPIRAGDIQGSVKVTVLDAHTHAPLTEACVLVNFSGKQRTKCGSPKGEYFISHAALSGPATISAIAANYTSYTIVDINTNELTIHLAPHDAPPSVKLTGKFSNWPPIKKDGIVDAGIMIPSLSVSQLLSFDFRQLMGPNVTIKVVGQTVNVPGNLVLPKQSENYLFFDVKFDKPNYLFNLSTIEPSDLTAITVRAPFKEFIDKVRAKAPASEIVTLLTIDRLGVKRNFSPTDASTENIHLSHHLEKNLQLSVANHPDAHQVLTVSAGQFSTGTEKFIPMGFSIIDTTKSTTSKITTAPNSESLEDVKYLAAAIAMKSPDKNVAFDGITGEIQRFGNHVPKSRIKFNRFFNKVTSMETMDKVNYLFDDVHNPGVSPHVDLTVSDIIYSNGETTKRLWTVVAPGSKTEFSLPTMAKDYFDQFENGLSWVLSNYALTDGETNYNELTKEEFQNTVTHISQKALQLN